MAVILEEFVAFQGRKSTTEERTLSAAQAVQLDKKLGGSAVQVSEIAVTDLAVEPCKLQIYNCCR